MTLATTVDNVAAMVGGLTGLKKVHGDPPDSLNLFPCAVVFARSGKLGTRQGRGVCTRPEYTIVVEVHHARQVLPQAVAAAQVWPDLLAAALWASETVDCYAASWVAGALQYNSETHYGVRFELTVRG